MSAVLVIEEQSYIVVESETESSRVVLEEAVTEVTLSEFGVDGALALHKIKPTGAHAASAISFVPTGSIASGDVQAALAEVASEATSGLAAEATTRADADAALSASISGFEADLDAEQTVRGLADAALQAEIDAEETARASAVSAEAGIRETNDNALQANIDAEAVARANGDSLEAAARAGADAIHANLSTGVHGVGSSIVESVVGSAAKVEYHRATEIHTIPQPPIIGPNGDQAVAGDDPRLTDARTPTGPAGGHLTGNYPNPTLSLDVATQAEFDAHVDSIDAHMADHISFDASTSDLITTTVQSALVELDTNKANIADAVMEGNPAGGVLGGTYPEPTFAVDMATQAELDAVQAQVDLFNSDLQDGHGLFIDDSMVLATMQTVIDSVRDTGGGAVIAKRGNYDLTGRLYVHDSVDLRGQSSAQTAAGVVFTCSDLGAGITFGDANIDVPTSMGLCGGFKINAAGIANDPFVVHCVVGATFYNINIENAVDAGQLLVRTANCLFLNVNAIDSGLDGIRLDGGASANEFHQCNYGRSGRYNGNLVSTEGVHPFGVDYNLHNVWRGCRFEYHSATTVASFRQDSGLDNVLDHCVVSSEATPITAMLTLVIVEATGSSFSAKLRINGSTLQHNFTAAGTVGLDVRDGTGVGAILTGVPNFVSSETAIKTASTGSVIVDGEVIYAGITNKASGASADALVGQTRYFHTDIKRPSGTTAMRIGIDGEPGYRLNFGPDGSVGFADGTNPVDTFWYRAAAGFMGLFGRLYLPEFVDIAEMAAPAAPAPNTGRLFARDNGAGKTQLCVQFPSGVLQVLATEP